MYRKFRVSNFYFSYVYVAVSSPDHVDCWSKSIRLIDCEVIIETLNAVFFTFCNEYLCNIGGTAMHADMSIKLNEKDHCFIDY